MTAASTQPARNDELAAWIAKLEAQNKTLGKRNRWLAVVLAVGVLLLVGVLWFWYLAAVRSYAVLRNVEIQRSPASQGRIALKFDVATPGKVYLRRTSGGITTEVVDRFHAAGPHERQWSWVYEPGEDIDVLLRYRGALWRRTTRRSFPTADSADIVILMDTTGSMSRSIETLKEKCVVFSAALTEKKLQHRFCLIGFGDTSETPWRDAYDFSANVQDFQQHVSGVKRFDGGDLPESALDALAVAADLPFAEHAARRVYLVTDADYHEPTAGGATAADIAAKLTERQILLNVFTREDLRPRYEPLAGNSGKVQTIAEFGQVLSEGRILED